MYTIYINTCCHIHYDISMETMIMDKFVMLSLAGKREKKNS